MTSYKRLFGILIHIKEKGDKHMAVAAVQLEDIFYHMMEIKNTDDFVIYTQEDLKLFIYNLKANNISNATMMCLLLNIINELSLKLNLQQLNNDELIQELEKTQIDKSLLDSINSRQLQIERVKAGHKIAYKNSANIDKVKELYEKGMKQEQIAKTLGVSSRTIARRIKEIKSMPEQQ